MCVINDKGDLFETNCLLVYLFILIDPLKCKENGGKCKASNYCFYMSQKLPEKKIFVTQMWQDIFLLMANMPQADIHI